MKYLFLIFVILLFSCKTTSEDISSEYYNIGNAYFDVGDYDKAIEYYSKALENDNPMENKIRYNLAVAYSESGRAEDGLVLFEYLLREDPENIKVLQSLAYTYFLMGDKEKSLHYYDQVLLLFEYDSIALFNKALILIDIEEEKALELQGEDSQSDDEALADTGEEGALQLQGEDSQSVAASLPDDGKVEALELLEKLYANDTSVEVVLKLGQLYREKEDWDSFVEIYEKSLTENKQNAEILTGLIDYYEGEGLFYKVLNYIDVLLDVEEVENLENYLFRKAEIELLELDDFVNGFESLKSAVDQGFSDEGRINNLLTSDRLLEADRIEDYIEAVGVRKSN